MHDEAHLFGIEIALLAIPQCRQRLGIELAVVGADAHIYGSGELYSDKASVARRVGKDIREIARGYKRGEARKLLHMTAIGTLYLQRRQLYEVLQEPLLHSG